MAGVSEATQPCPDVAPKRVAAGEGVHDCLSVPPRLAPVPPPVLCEQPRGCLPVVAPLAGCAAVPTSFPPTELCEHIRGCLPVVAPPARSAVPSVELHEHNRGCLPDGAPLARSAASSGPSCSRSPKVLLLCSGPDFRQVSLSNLLQQAGFGVQSYDVVNGPDGDVTDDAVWDRILVQLSAAEYAGVFASPPCSTFSKLRKIPGGPPILRSATGPHRYGLAKISIKQKEMVRMHNLIAVRCATALTMVSLAGGVFVYETPALEEGEVSMLRLDEYGSLMALPDVRHMVGIQCSFSSLSSKPTSWVTRGVTFDDMPLV